MMRIGLDIGGANIKIANSDGSVALTVYAPLWKNREALYETLRSLVVALSHDAVEPAEPEVGVVMTGQLCDCFRTKAEGILFIKNAVTSTFKNAKFFGSNCSFSLGSDVERNPMQFDATNWLASAFYLSKDFKDFIFVDVGSTTTDIIPVVRGEIKAAKRDYERLMRGELIYEGVLRTNVAFLLRKLRIKGEECGVSSEIFAVTADAYLALGMLSADEYTCDTPDASVNSEVSSEAEDATCSLVSSRIRRIGIKGIGGRGEKTKEAALRRLSRVVCADLEEIGQDSAMEIAEQVKEAQIRHLSDALREKKMKFGINDVISAGIGEFIVKEAAERNDMNLISTAEMFGKDVSAVFPAFAVSNLLEYL